MLLGGSAFLDGEKVTHWVSSQGRNNLKQHPNNGAAQERDMVTLISL